MASPVSSPPPGSTTTVAIAIDSRQFSREAALKAAYWFTKDFYIEFPTSQTEDSFEVLLKAKDVLPTLENPAPKSLQQAASEFRNALVEAELRIRVQKETSAIRELLLAKAFAEAGVLESSPAGSFDDPVSAAEIETSPVTNLVVIDRSRE